tara:strand:+ start:82994 stop:83248 length:255 start_codon:yes stop_codon:yes gene_type:complete
MLIEDIRCPECGGSATDGTHKMGCSSKLMMNAYCDVVEYLPMIPDVLLTKLSTLIYAEQTERTILSKSEEVLDYKVDIGEEKYD